MNIQAEKIDLIKMIINTDNPAILSSAIDLFKNQEKSDFWDTLSLKQKEEIKKGITEIDNGDTVDYEKFISKHRP